MSTRAAGVSACLLLTQCGQHLSCVIVRETVAAADHLVLRDARLVRFVDNGWSEQVAAELHVVDDGGQWGVCDPQRSWWVPHHSLLPYHLVELSAAEHVRLIGHIDAGRPWDLFKHIQLVFLAEEGFGGGRDRLTARAGYGDQIRADRWYLSAQARG